MTRDAWTTWVATANLANAVHAQPDATTAQNGLSVLKYDPDLAAFTELWHQSGRDAIVRLVESTGRRYGYVGPPNNSVVLAYSPRHWTFEAAGDELLHGRVAGKFGVVSDRRLMPWVRLVGHDGRKVIFAGVHLAPPATKRGPAAVLAAAAARRIAKARIKAFVRRTGYPVILAGDWNEQGKPIGEQIAGKRVTYTALGRIDKIAVIDGANVTMRIGKGTLWSLPSSDHPGQVRGLATSTPRWP